ncbi:hypothetical protein L7H23_08805 [Sphingopyxis sp. BSN-002]|uniref:hypothetical protein n=1 Tax=Sphingopyxis sp. BSN-002 TaxID=2911495 RepID=UPI001EDA838C|nr:hypothetical protein [Sphingopyxis sp. BSN-002]UKK86179.1 hypothetical protein L7H23_08805 [Sphingopyxis sp. BSN-002]
MKLVMDLDPAIPLRTGMDDDHRDLVARLCTEVGIIMEDMSPVALMIGGRDTELRERLDQLDRAIGEMTALIAAARVVATQGGPREFSLTS